MIVLECLCYVHTTDFNYGQRGVPILFPFISIEAHCDTKILLDKTGIYTCYILNDKLKSTPNYSSKEYIYVLMDLNPLLVPMWGFLQV